MSQAINENVNEEILANFLTETMEKDRFLMSI